jgi:hypothetical protein
MRSNATVYTDDLGMALDYLEGLQTILARLDADGLGREEDDPLLQALDGTNHYSGAWEPLRYQREVGEGWAYVSAALGELRERLLAGYSESAL